MGFSCLYFHFILKLSLAHFCHHLRPLTCMWYEPEQISPSLPHFPHPVGLATWPGITAHAGHPEQQ